MTAQGIWELNQAVSASGSSGPVGVAAWENFWLSLVTGTPAGTTPTLALHVDGVDPFGNVIPDIVTLPAGFSLTTAAGAAQCSFGVNGGSGLLACVPALIQVRWVVGGATPSYPGTQVSLFGR